MSIRSVGSSAATYTATSQSSTDESPASPPPGIELLFSEASRHDCDRHEHYNSLKTPN